MFLDSVHDKSISSRLVFCIQPFGNCILGDNNKSIFPRFSTVYCNERELPGMIDEKVVSKSTTAKEISSTASGNSYSTILESSVCETTLITTVNSAPANVIT